MAVLPALLAIAHLGRANIVEEADTTRSARSSKPVLEGGFEAQCKDHDDHGWPRFENLTALQADHAWASYFEYIYGALPTRFPVCVFDFHALSAKALAEFGVNSTGLLPAPKMPTNPGRYPPVFQDLKEGDLYPGGQLGYQIFHSTWEPVPPNGWVEVTHTVIPSEVSAFWAWRQKGSGVWFNVGRTIVFPTPADPALIHAEAIANLTRGCSKNISHDWPQLESDIFGACAREKGYDSVQFGPTAGAKPWGVFGMVGLTELVLVNLDGDKGCGVSDPSKTLLRGGWLADGTCECETAPIAEHCGIVIPQGCSSMPGGACQPALCKKEPCQFSVPPCKDTSCSKRADGDRATGVRNPLEAAMMARMRMA